MIKFGGKGMLFFLLFWSFVTCLFDGLMISDAVRRVRSLGYRSVPCVIISAEVRESHDSEGSSYTPEITYRYSVEGHEYQGGRIYAGNRQGFGSRRAHRLTSVYAAGMQTNAWFNPASPSDAVLRRGFLGNELFMALFMTPFNLVMVGLWAAFYYARRNAKHPPVAGGVKLIATREGMRVRLRTTSPALAAGAALGGVCFVSIFVLAFTKGEYAPPPIVGLVWAAAIAAAVWAWFWRVRREASGREDLLLHSDGKRLTLPQTCGRKSSLTVGRGDISALDVHLEFDSYKKPSRFIPTLVMRSGERLQLAKWTDEDQATRFNDWLRSELQLPPPRLGTASA